MNRRSWVIGIYVGLAAGLLVAAAMTILDWRANPSGLFHDESGTNWLIVGETALSWFWPVALAALLITVAVYAALTVLRPRP
jgi:H+/Cl- antiporter ClcA